MQKLFSKLRKAKWQALVAVSTIGMMVLGLGSVLSLPSAQATLDEFVIFIDETQALSSVESEGKDYLTKEVFIKFKQAPQVKIMTTQVQSNKNTLVATSLENFEFVGDTKLIKLKDLDVEQALKHYQDHPAIEYIEPNYKYYLDSVPNDPHFSNLWGLHNSGQTGGAADADLDAPEAWDAVGAGNEVLVAVLDTGIDFNHEDLADNVWTNPNEIADNGVDDDGNGYIDDLHGYDFYSNDGTPQDGDSHGTHCAGTIAAVGSNNKGVIGVNPHAKIVALKIFSDAGSYAGVDNVVKAIEYSVDVGAKVSSNSWGGGSYSQTLKNAIAQAGQAGQLFIAAAGNSGGNNDTSPHYPSNYALNNIIAVASTDHNDQLSSFSCYGQTSVDLGAPGSSIYSTVPNSYGYKSGTSMATPHVSGVASLVWSHTPTLSHTEVKQKILNYVDPLAALNGKTVSGGRLNAYQAITGQVQQPPQISLTPSTLNAQVVIGNTTTETLTLSNTGEGTLNWNLAQSDYQALDSNQTNGPTYNWQDISTTGTAISLGDDDYEQVNLPFDFPFYGATKNTVKISSNGYLTFGSDGTDHSNDSIPNTTDPNDFIAPFWDDLNPSSSGTVYSYHDTANQRFIVQYEAVVRYYTSTPETFQVILAPNGEILFQYQDMQGTLTSATIGIENADGSAGLQVAYNESYVANNLAVLVKQSANWLSVAPTTGEVAGSNSQALTVTLDATNLAVGTYNENLTIQSNDSNNPTIALPVTLTVTSGSSGCTPPATGDWLITQSCTFTGTATAPASVIVDQNAVLTIDNTAVLNLDFANYELRVQDGSGVLIKDGGEIH